MTVVLQELRAMQEGWGRGLVSCPGRAATPFALLRGAGTLQAARPATTWAPARQRTAEPDDASHRRGGAALYLGHESGLWRITASTSSLRAQEAIQNSSAEKHLNCFRLRLGFGGQIAALAMTEQEAPPDFVQRLKRALAPADGGRVWRDRGVATTGPRAGQTRSRSASCSEAGICA